MFSYYSSSSSFYAPPPFPIMIFLRRSIPISIYMGKQEITAFGQLRYIRTRAGARSHIHECGYVCTWTSECWKSLSNRTENKSLMMPIIKIKKKICYGLTWNGIVHIFWIIFSYSFFISLMYSHYMNLIFLEQVLKLNTICVHIRSLAQNSAPEWLSIMLNDYFNSLLMQKLMLQSGGFSSVRTGTKM